MLSFRHAYPTMQPVRSTRNPHKHSNPPLRNSIQPPPNQHTHPILAEYFPLALILSP